MNVANPSDAARPWYREFWPWALMLPPALAVAGGFSMLYLATATPSALVVADYARIEELTNERYERDNEAVRLGLEAVLSISPATQRIELALAAGESFEMPRALELRLQHATNPAADRELRLVRYGESYVADAALAPGLFHLELMPEDHAWRLGARVQRLTGEIRLTSQTAGD